MGVVDLIKDKKQLLEVANILADEIKHSNEPVVSRYLNVAYDSIYFFQGKTCRGNGTTVNVNKEMMKSGIYSSVSINDLTPDNFRSVAVARDIDHLKFNFNLKGLNLPTEELSFVEPVPSYINHFDRELKEFTKEHGDAKVTRRLYVEQRVIVNSAGGRFIQSIPFFEILYSHGHKPIPTSRQISAMCTSVEDIKRFPELIKYMSDPTPEKRIKGAKSFGEAFDELHKISKLKFESLEEAGIPMSELYDIVVLSGLPIHEIFGHHFEEPMDEIRFGESATFKYRQNIKNKDIIITDDPQTKIEGFRVEGFTNFDAYGRKREPRIHIKDGRVAGFLGSEYADSANLKRFMNMEKSSFVGNSSHYSDGTFPQPRMSCTVLDGPAENIDLEGKIIMIPSWGYTLDGDKTYALLSSESYVVKDGQPMRVVPLKVTGGINQALANIVLLDDITYNSGICSKSGPIHSLHSNRTAIVPVSQFAKSQLWEAQQVYPSDIADNHLKLLINK